jgi:hypothetical protein
MAFLPMPTSQYCSLPSPRCVVPVDQPLHSRQAINLVNSTITYTYDPRTCLYQQVSFAFRLGTLLRLLTVNSHRLDNIKTTVDVELERRVAIPAGTFLSVLVRAGIKERALVSTILAALMEELQRKRGETLTCIYQIPCPIDP